MDVQEGARRVFADGLEAKVCQNSAGIKDHVQEIARTTKCNSWHNIQCILTRVIERHNLRLAALMAHSPIAMRFQMLLLSLAKEADREDRLSSLSR